MAQRSLWSFYVKQQRAKAAPERSSSAPPSSSLLATQSSQAYTRPLPRDGISHDGPREGANGYSHVPTPGAPQSPKDDAVEESQAEWSPAGQASGGSGGSGNARSCGGEGPLRRPGNARSPPELSASSTPLSAAAGPKRPWPSSSRQEGGEAAARGDGPQTPPALSSACSGYKRMRGEEAAVPEQQKGESGPTPGAGAQGSNTTQSQSNSNPASASLRRRFLDALGSGDVGPTAPGQASAEARAKYWWLDPDKIRDAKGRRPSDPSFDARSLLVPPEVRAKMSASQKQYWDIKMHHMDALLFFKVGSFYELYELDAEVGARELDWKLTLNGVGKCRQVGVPESGVDEALTKLVARGYKVGRVEQTETGQEAKAKRGPGAMVNRELTQVLSAATKCEGDLSPDAVHLLALVEDCCTGPQAPPRPSLGSSQGSGSGSGSGTTVGADRAGHFLGFAFVDAASGRCYSGACAADPSGAALSALLAQVAPQEIIFPAQGVTADTRRQLRRTSCPGKSPPMGDLQPQGARLAIRRLGLRGHVAGMDWCSPSKSAEGQGQSQEGAQEQREGAGLQALAMLLLHLQHLKWPQQQIAGLQLLPYSVFSACLRLDGATLANLELLENSANGGTAGTLLGHLDSCATPAGRRLLRRWICHPLQSVAEIEARQDAVADILACPDAASLLRLRLRPLPDLERLLGRVRAMAVPLAVAVPAPSLRGREHQRRVSTFCTTVEGMGEALELLLSLGRRPPPSPHSPPGSAWAPFRSQLLQELCARAEAKDGAALAAVAALRACILKPTTGAGKGRSAAGKKGGPGGAGAGHRLLPLNDSMVPPSQGLGAEEDDVEHRVLGGLVAHFLGLWELWASVTSALAQLDVLIAFAAASAAASGPTCRPRFLPKSGADHGRAASPDGQARAQKRRQVAGGGAVFQARGLWHPYAVGSGGGAVVPNDLLLGGAGRAPETSQCPEECGNESSQEQRGSGPLQECSPRALLLTGPNMGGKSTLLRATCLAVVMAQMGCHVAAKELILSPADIIFTRLGASDRIMSGESTFLVECKEASRVLQDATSDSVVILDELGRGTSTFDGVAIAHAVLEYITSSVDCRLLFATHYHTLTTDFGKKSDRVGIFHMQCVAKSTQALAAPLYDPPEGSSCDASITNELVFLYKLHKGPCPSSYGLQVARMAGIPLNIVQRASTAASKLEEELRGRPDHHLPVAISNMIRDMIPQSMVIELDMDKVLGFWQRASRLISVYTPKE